MFIKSQNPYSRSTLGHLFLISLFMLRSLASSFFTTHAKTELVQKTEIEPSKHYVSRHITHLLPIGYFIELAVKSQADDLEVAIANANRLHKALTGGVPLTESNPLYSGVVSKILVKDYTGAADLITDPTSGADEFYYEVANMTKTMNNTGSATNPPNEIQAMFLGAARDGLDLTDLLQADFTYHDPTGTSVGCKYEIDDSGIHLGVLGTSCAGGGAAGQFCNSNHYVAVWTKTNPKISLVRQPHPQFPGVGIFTSWAWAKEYDSAGTGRRNIRGLLENLFLVTIDSMRSDYIPDTPINGDGHGVRKDIPRDDPNYTSNCIQCHSWMDRMVAPFLVKDAVATATRFVYGFNDKLNVKDQNPTFQVLDTNFKFIFSPEQARTWGVDESQEAVQTYSATGVKFIEGSNLRDFARIISHSRGFYRGMVKRIIAQVLMHKLISVQNMTSDDQNLLLSQSDTIEAFTTILMQNKNLRNIYGLIAIWYSINS